MTVSRRTMIAGTALSSAALLAGAADAQSLGVKPGSPDDQSASLQRALAAAAAKGQPLSLAPGIYRISRVAVPDGAVLVGMPDVTKLVASGDGPMLYAQKAARIRLYGLTLDAALAKVPERTGVIQIDDVEEAVLSELQVENAGRNGIVLQRSGGRVDHCRVVRAKQAAIWSRDGKGVAIVGNEILACANNGILVHRLQRADDGAVISGNRVEDTGAADGGTGPNGNGINVFRADGVIVEGNSVRRSAFSAIRAADSGNVVIAANQCLKSGETALYVEFAYEGAVVSGNLVDGAGNGISVVNFDVGGRLAAVTGNVVRNLFRRPRPEETEIAYGVGIAVEADAAVTGNVVEEAPTTGLGLGWGKFGRNIAATGNMIRRCEVGIGISVVEGTGIAAISGNVITESRRAAILGFRWNEAVTGDLALGGAEKLPGLSIGGNAVT